MIDGRADISDGARAESELVGERAAVADAGQVHAQGDMAGLGQASRKPDMQPVRPDPVDDPGIHQQYGWGAAARGWRACNRDECTMLTQPHDLLADRGVAPGLMKRHALPALPDPNSG